MHPSKVYVPVTVTFDQEGSLLPRSLVWEDGREYVIDKVLEVRPAPAQKAGGQGDRYTVQISNRKRYLFFERNTEISQPSPGKWFLERKET